MDKDKLKILELIMGMWQNDLIEGNGGSCFETWCMDNIENEKQQELLDEIKGYVDLITFALDEE